MCDVVGFERNGDTFALPDPQDAWIVRVLARVNADLAGTAGHDNPRPGGEEHPEAQDRSTCEDEELVSGHRLSARAPNSYRRTRRSRSALLTTDTELKDMAKAARTGLSRMPKNGYSTPAATGTPAAL